VKSLRLFIAMDFSSPIVEAVTRFQNQLRKEMSRLPIRWVAPESMHGTLQFLGDTPTDQIAAIEAAITSTASQFAPIALHVAGAGSFPSFQKPQVLWIGIHADHQLKKLVALLQQELTPLGFKPEGDFVPHLTLGRLSRNADSAQRQAASVALAPWQHIEIGEDRAQEIILYQSDLSQNGPIYTALFRAPLKNMLN
jgi:2'-5' RNA ligase